MKIYLNDFLLNDEANRVYIDEPLEGLDTPDIRTSRGNNTGQSGGYVGAQFYDMRVLTIPGRVFSSNVTEALQKRREIQAALPIHPDVIVVRVEDDDGRSYIFDTHLIDFKMPITRGRMKSAFKIELLAPDSVIYDNTAGSALTTSVTQVIPGGIQFTDTSPLFDSFYFTAGTSDVTVTNTSALNLYPTITISGAINSPVLTNRTTGESFRLDAYSVGSDQTTQIDLKSRTVLLGLTSALVNGVFPEGSAASVFGYAPDDADWWALVPGDNVIVFSSGGGTDSTTATLRWRPGYRGI